MNLDAPIVAGLQLGAGGIEVEIPGNKQVQVAVQIVIREGGAGVPDAAPDDAGFCGDVDKGAVTSISIQKVRAKVADKQIGVPIVIVICGDTTKTPAPTGNAGFGSYISERSVMVVAI